MEEIMKFVEKRKSPRIKLSSPVEYRMLRGSPDAKKGSIISDISAGGVRFITDEFLAFTARLVVDVTMPVPERSFSAVSKVAWIRKLPRGDRYEIGTQFLEMAKDDKERISDYINRLAAS